jgi:hypothetical protein
MPQFINSPYSTGASGGGIADMLTSMGQSQFGNTAQRAMITQNMLAKQRENAAAQAEADAFRSNNSTELGANSILGGRPAGDYLGYNTGMAALNSKNNTRDPTLTTALTAEGKYPQSPVSQDSAQANQRTITGMQGQNAIATEQSKPVTIMGPDGNMHIVPSNQTEHLINNGYRLIPTADQSTALFINPQGSPVAPVPNAPPSSAQVAPQQPTAPAPPMQAGAPVPFANPITGDSTPEHFSPTSLPPQIKPAPQPVQAPQSLAPPSAQPAAPQQPALVNGRNEAYLSTLSPGMQAYVKAYVDGKEIPGRQGGLDPGTARAVLIAAQNYEPGFDVNKYAARRNTATDYATGGKTGQALASASMSIKHLDQFNQAIDALKNYNTLPAIANPLHAAYGSQLDPGYQDALANAEAKAEALSQELPRTFRGANGAEADVVRNLGNLDIRGAAPNSLHAFTRSIGDLIGSRVESMQENYDRVMNPVGAATSPLLPASTMGALTRLRAHAAPPAAGNSNWTDPKTGQVYQVINGRLHQ